MVILGVILGIGALVCFLVRQFVMKDKAILNKVAAGLALAAGKYIRYDNSKCQIIIVEVGPILRI